MSARTSFAVFSAAYLITAVAWAAVPQSLSYQGYLTDRVGSPIMESQTITFSIYTGPVGGVPVWHETKSVAFANGLFSTRLGEVSAFPLDLFDVPLWLGMTIGTDSEMEPRRQLTTAGFSFRAEDADALQGRTAFELDQSLHVDDLGNPHEVSAGEIGAASQGQLAAHATNTGNPHIVSVGQTGGTSAATFGTHAAEVAAHHVRYVDGEAVSAMGDQGTSNPLNHGRYSDGESVAAVLAADGEGSGLDADVVDGLQAAEIISAASAQASRAYTFVGYSASVVRADQGLAPMYAACQATFGVDARMATSQDIIETADLLTQPGLAWVRPSIIALYVQSNDQPIEVELSGLRNNQGRFNCQGWTTGGEQHFAIDSSIISFRTTNCNQLNENPVACAVPE